MPPVGFKRSRALWDNARRPRPRKWEALQAFLRALFYELQPIRSSQIPVNSLPQMGRHAWQQISQATARIPSLLRTVTSFLAQRTRRQYLWTVGVLVYYILVRWIHYALDAGPAVLILTALVAIFTIGLGDNSNEDGISAYSVFNRGFQRLLGTIDAEDLVAQQMGGLPGQRNPAAARPNDHPPPRRPPAQEPRPAARQAAAAAQPADGENYNNQEQVDLNDRPRRRLPGKKARRQNLEQRRELRRQREAALAMGFGADDQSEALAMQRLLDDQFAELEEDEE
jgi:hypothetical protein